MLPTTDSSASPNPPNDDLNSSFWRISGSADVMVRTNTSAALTPLTVIDHVMAVTNETMQTQVDQRSAATPRPPGSRSTASVATPTATNAPRSSICSTGWRTPRPW